MDQSVNILKLCADKNRLRILKLLNQQPMCVCELAYILGVTQPSISRHLKKMKDSGLIQGEQDGFWTNYHLSGDVPQVKDILRYLDKWMADDAQLKADQKKMKTVDRTRLCCR